MRVDLTDLVVALGLVLVIEGLVLALAPGMPKRMVAVLAAAPESRLRLGGLLAIALGVGVVWLMRG